jgi:hypothetical protein
MNLRQKAKHFKKLYEDALPKKPYPVIHETHRAKHYKAYHMVDKREIDYAPSPQLLQTQIENSILRELRPIIRDNLKAEKDLYTNKIIYSLDVWM